MLSPSGDFFKDNGSKSPSSIICFIKRFNIEKSTKLSIEVILNLPALKFIFFPVAASLNNLCAFVDAKYISAGLHLLILPKGATLLGNGPDVLNRVKLVGNHSKMDTGIGTCGKDGQSVPVGVGQPTMLIENLTVGGTATA